MHRFLSLLSFQQAEWDCDHFSFKSHWVWEFESPRSSDAHRWEELGTEGLKELPRYKMSVGQKSSSYQSLQDRAQLRPRTGCSCRNMSHSSLFPYQKNITITRRRNQTELWPMLWVMASVSGLTNGNYQGWEKGHEANIDLHHSGDEKTFLGSPQAYPGDEGVHFSFLLGHRKNTEIHQ